MLITQSIGLMAVKETPNESNFQNTPRGLASVLPATQYNTNIKVSIGVGSRTVSPTTNKHPEGTNISTPGLSYFGILNSVRSPNNPK